MAQFGTSPVIYKVEAFSGVRTKIDSVTVSSVLLKDLTLATAPSFAYAASTYHAISIAGGAIGESRGITNIVGSVITVDSAFSVDPTAIMITENVSVTAVPADISTMAKLHAAFLANPLSVRIWTGRNWAEIAQMTKIDTASQITPAYNVIPATHLKMLSSSAGAYFHGTVGVINTLPALPTLPPVEAIPASKVLSGGLFKDVAEGISADIGFHEQDTNVANDSRKTYIKTTSTLNAGSPVLVKDDLYRIGLKNCNDSCYWSMGLYVKADL
jgi:hypothetical protein